MPQPFRAMANSSPERSQGDEVEDMHFEFNMALDSCEEVLTRLRLQQEAMRNDFMRWAGDLDAAHKQHHRMQQLLFQHPSAQTQTELGSDILSDAISLCMSPSECTPEKMFDKQNIGQSLMTEFSTPQIAAGSDDATSVKDDVWVKPDAPTNDENGIHGSICNADVNVAEGGTVAEEGTTSNIMKTNGAGTGSQDAGRDSKQESTRSSSAGISSILRGSVFTKSKGLKSGLRASIASRSPRKTKFDQDEDGIKSVSFQQDSNGTRESSVFAVNSNEIEDHSDKGRMSRRKPLQMMKSYTRILRDLHSTCSDADAFQRRVDCLLALMTVSERISVFSARELSGSTDTVGFKTRIMATQRAQISIIDSIMSIVIILNTITMGLSMDLQAHWAGWFLLDCAFAVTFTVECSLKMRIFGLRGYFRGSDARWNVFEMLLSAMSVAEVLLIVISSVDRSLARLLRIIRLCRFARVARISRFSMFEDLFMMINGASGGVKTLAWAAILITVPLYAISMLMREMLGDKDLDGIAGTESFRTLPISFYTMFRCVVGQECTTQDGKPIFLLISTYCGWGYSVVYGVTFMLMTVGLLNVIMAIFVENTVAAAKHNGNKVRRARLLDQNLVKTKMQDMILLILEMHPEIEGLKNGLTLEEIAEYAAVVEIDAPFFERLNKCREFQDILSDLDVAEEDQAHLFQTLDVDHKGVIGVEACIIGINHLRGEARRGDIVTINMTLSKMQDKLNSMYDHVKFMKSASADALASSPSYNSPFQMPSLRDVQSRAISP